MQAKEPMKNSSPLAARLVKDALRLRAAARKQRSKRGPGRFSESRAQEREARALFAEARQREDRAEADVLERAQVVLATLTGLESNALRERRFDLAVVDEATQSVEPALYLALLKADEFVTLLLLAIDEIKRQVAKTWNTRRQFGIGLRKRTGKDKKRRSIRD